MKSYKRGPQEGIHNKYNTGAATTVANELETCVLRCYATRYERLRICFQISRILFWQS